jgi:hypothetical protein
MNYRLWIISLITAWLASIPVLAEGPPWFLDHCAASYQSKADHLRQEMAKAQPGSDIFVPKPFPRTDSEVIVDLVAQIRSTFFSGGQAPPAIADLLTKIDAGKIRFEIIPVVEWRPERCRYNWGKVDSSFLVRLYDSQTGRELTRASLVDSGLLSVVAAPRPGGRLGMIDHDIEPMDTVRSVATQLGAPAAGFQYVAVASPTILCQETAPCIAFRAAGRAYLYRSGKLFQLVTDRPGFIGLTTSEFMREGVARRGAIAALHSGEHVVTVGANRLAVAVPVPLRQ